MCAYAAKHDTIEKRRAYDAERKASYREARGIGLKGKPFIGVDGEGGNDSEGHHQYYLLTAGGAKIATGKPLTAHECLDFISRFPSEAYYVGYFFDYDVTMILRGLPPDKIARLFDRAVRTKVISPGREYTYPVDWGGFQIDYLPHKEFKVRRRLGKDPRTDRSVFSPWVVINDVGSFFQTSFIKAITNWEIGTEAERERIAEGKDMRADFGALTKDIIEYNALEIDLLQKLMTSFRDVCEEIGYMPSRWQGPGNLASAMLRRHGVPKNKDLHIPPEVIDAADRAYYGGRFETTAVGTISNNVYAYDINSAYPDALTKLPCLIHGIWDNLPASRRDEVKGQALYLAHGSYDHDPATKRTPGLYNFSHRDKQGHIFYPSKGSGWYWSPEIEQAAHQIFTPDIIYVYRKNCDCTPFDWVPVVYDMRIALGKTKKGGVLKLGLNSIYGKLAQSIGAAPYANPVWAGLITSLTRAKLMSVCHYPDIEGLTISRIDGCLCNTVVMLATDAVFCTRRLHVTKSGAHKGGWREQRITPTNELGGWDYVQHEGMHIIQPGLYFTGAGNTPKTRGVPRQRIVEMRQDFYDLYAKLSHGKITRDEAFITVPLKQFMGLRICNHRGALELAGEWLWCGENGEGKKISYDWRNKRNPQTARGAWGTNPPLITYPYRTDAGESTPYSKDIGRMMAEERELGGGMYGAPDWATTFYDRDMG